MDKILGLLKKLGPGRMGNTAYDTSWVARLIEIDADLSNDAIDWLCEHQLPDGSWGAERPLYYHDRVISTLSAMIALTHRGRRRHDKLQVENGLLALEKITTNATKGLSADIHEMPAGFEMIVPTLVAEAEKLGIIKQQGERILGRLTQLRNAKIAKLSGYKINRYITTALSAELAGVDSVNLLDIENLQESNGSVGNSPSATAYFALWIKPSDEGAFNYLRGVIKDGGVPFVAPFEIFERIWMLWNILLVKDLEKEIYAEMVPHLDYIEKHWRKGQGIGFSSSYTPTDGDDTAIGYEILAKAGRKVDFDAVLSFEENDHFRCFQLEATTSTDVNIHMLGAFKAAGLEKGHPLVKKALDFIRKMRLENKYWIDKWNLSPYYTTSHVIISANGYDDELCSQSVQWMLDTQKADGSWGFYGFSTAEETAYCIQALAIWRRRGKKIPTGRIEQAAFWLKKNAETVYPPLWIGKSLYCPENLVKISIESALRLAGE